MQDIDFLQCLIPEQFLAQFSLPCFPDRSRQMGHDARRARAVHGAQEAAQMHP